MTRLAALALALVCALPGLGTAQEAAPADDPRGRRALRLHVGMWTSHLDDLRRGLDANWLVAVGWKGLYGGTFINSFGKRGYALAVERDVVRVHESRVPRGVGYRLGLVTGYDERLVGLARWTPVLPALQVMGDLAVGSTGMEVAWTGKVASMSPFMRVAR